MRKINYKDTSKILIILIAITLFITYGSFFGIIEPKNSLEELLIVCIISTCYLIYELILAIKSKPYFEFFDEKIVNFENCDIKNFDLENIKFASRVII